MCTRPVQSESFGVSTLSACSAAVRRMLGRDLSSRRAVSLLPVVLTLLACSGAQDGPSEPIVTPTPTLQRELLDLPYASVSRAQRLDLFLPATGAGPFPVLVWIHGGGWAAGSKNLSPTGIQRQMTARGYAVASVEYRLSGEAKYPAAVLDVKAAIRFLRANATRFALNSDRIAVWGSSAGGHLAALVGVTGGVALFDDATLGNATQSSRVQAVVDWFGPSELLQMDADGAAQGCPLFGGVGHDNSNSPEGLWLGGKPSALPARAREASPVTWVSTDDAPALVQHGGIDCTVPTAQGRRFRDALRTALDTSRVIWIELPNSGHGGPAFESAANVLVVAAFLDRWLR